jgi:hypothetical protein
VETSLSQNVEWLSSVEAFGRLTDTLDSVLEDVTMWTALATNELTVAEVLVQLTVADAIAMAALAGIGPADVDVDRETGRTLSSVDLKDTQQIRARWRRQALGLAMFCRSFQPDTLVRHRGAPSTLSQVVAARAFDTWLHTQDVRASLQLELVAPPAPLLSVLADAKVRSLPFVIDDSRNDKCARLVLTGSGGGAWSVPFHVDTVLNEPVVTVSMDSLDFCLVVANRVRTSDVSVRVEGELGAAGLLLERAPLLARL